MNDPITIEHIRAKAQRADALKRESQSLIRAAVREAHAAGLSQREIAAAVGRSQPEVSRLLRFSPVSERGRALARHRGEITRLAREAGFTNVRVFGSLARGDEHTDSDIDLLVTPTRPFGLFALARLERAIGALLNANVDVVPDGTLRDPAAARALAEAVPL